MKKIFITRPLPGDSVEKLLSLQNVQVNQWPEDRPPTADELLIQSQNASIILSNVEDQFDAKKLSQLPSLKLISQFGVGIDNIDTEYCQQKGICVANTPGVLTQATATLALALTLASLRNFKAAMHHVQQREWTYWMPKGFIGQDLDQVTLGIFGMGRIGQEMARLSSALGMSIIYHNRSSVSGLPPEFTSVTFPELLKKSDVISVHTDLNAQTRGRFNQEAFIAMKKEAIFINTARGAIHHEVDLLAALNQGEIHAAGLDVTCPEPIASDSLLIDHPRAIILPHIGSASTQARAKMAQMSVENILSYLQNGRPQHIVI